MRRLTALLVTLLLLPAGSLVTPAAADLAEDGALPDLPDLDRVDRFLDDPLAAGDEMRLIVGHGPERPDRLDSAVAIAGGTLVRTDAVLGFTVVTVPTATRAAFADALALDPEIRYVNEDGAIHAHFVPDDPYYPQQWGPPTIGVESVWNTTFGNQSIEVAVIDTGVDYTHPDLADNVCRFGPDFYNDDDDPMDDHYHGTHVAGTVAASIDNDEGVAGMGDVCVVPIKVLSAYGSGRWSDLASALRWSADNGIEIISMSLGGCCDPGEPVTSAIEYAAAAGVLIIASAGNAYCDPVGYPAAYPEVVAVASAREPGDQVSSFSSCGPEVEVTAPGEDIVSTVPLSVEPSGYAYLSGTSMAAPHASGVAALFWSQHPGLNAAEVRCILAQKATDLLEVGRDVKSGFGRIDAAAMFVEPLCDTLPPEIPLIQGRSGDLSAALQWTTPFAWGGVDGYRLYRGTSADALDLLADVGPVNTFVDTNLTEGTTYHYAVEAYNDAGGGNRSGTTAVTVESALTLPHSLDFESGFGDWTATGLWHTTNDRVGAGNLSAYFGQENGEGLEDNDYDTGAPERGTIESPAIRLPDEPVHMSFWQYFDLEHWQWEHPIVEVATESDPFTYVEVWSMGAFDPYEGLGAVDLSAYAGQVVYLRFVVDTIDSWANDHEGWYLDDVTIATGAAPDLPPTTSIVVPREGNLYPAAYYAAGPYTDGNGDQDVVNVTLQIDDGMAVGLPLQDHYWFTEYDGLDTGTHTILVTVRDSAGLETNASVTFDVDGEPPTPGIKTPPGGSSVGCSVTLGGTAQDTGGAGLAYLYVYSSGSSSSESVASPDDHVGYADFDGEDEADWELDLDLTMVAAGAIDVVVITVDRAGNRNVTAHPLVRDDMDCRPHIQLDTPQDGATISCSISVTGSVTSPVGRNLTWIDAYIGGKWVGWDGLWENGSFQMEIATGRLAEGSHDLRLIAYDQTWAWNDTTVNIVRDQTDCLPEATIDTPAAGTLVDCSFIATGTAASPRGDVPLYISFRLADRWAGATSVEPDGTWEATLGSGAAPPGTQTLVARVYDEDGNWNETSLTLERSDADCRPTVTITSPEPGTAAGCTLTVQGTAAGKDGARLQWIDLLVDDRYWVGWDWLEYETTVDWKVTANVGRLPAGTHNLTAIVADEFGVWNESAPLEFEVLETDCVPEIEVSTPEPGSTVAGQVPIEGTVVIPEDTSVTVEVWAGHDYLGRRSVTNGSWSFNWNTFGLDNGTYYIEVYADASNGYSDWVWFQVEVANIPDPRIETESFEGTIGCSVGVLMVQTADLCAEGGSHQGTIGPGLTHGRLTLAWEGDLPADLERLQLGLSLPGHLWTARAAPGDDEVVLEFTLDKTFGMFATADLDVRAAGGDPNLSLVDEVDYTLYVEWGYDDEPLP